MKVSANSISIMRLFLVFTLLLTKPLSIAFWAIYLVCGISDFLDGYIARKTDTVNRLGTKLDSLADLIMVVVLMSIFYPLIKPADQIIVWIVIIGIIRVASIIVVFVKYKTFQILHTYGNKVTGFLLFILPLLLVFLPADMLISIICLVASISTVEELLIHLSSNELQADRKSIFSK